MYETIKVQIIIDSPLRCRVEDRIREYGFGSIQQLIRMFLTSFAKGHLMPAFVNQGTVKWQAKFLPCRMRSEIVA